MSKKQYNLFEEEKKEDKKEKDSLNQTKTDSPKNLTALKLTKFDNKVESKQKKLIKSRLEKIKKLNSLLEKDKEILHKMKSMYQDALKDDIENNSKVVVEYAQKLISRYKQKSFTQAQRDTLEYLIEECFENLQTNDYPYEEASELVNEYNSLKEHYNKDRNHFGDDVFKDLFKAAFGDEELDDDESDEEIDQEEFEDEFQKQIIRQMLNDMGLEVDDDFFEGLNTNDPNFELKFQQRVFEYAKKEQEEQDRKEKSKKVITTDKEFTKLYKNLAKKIHPDLTTDEVERQRREELMKELSEIWEKRDYYGLLVIQSKIDPNLTEDVNLNENQLKQIAEDLFKKIKSIESERFMFKRLPENEFFFSNFFARSDKKIKQFIEEYKKKVNHDTEATINHIGFLKNQKTTKSFLKVVQEELESDSMFW